MDIRIAKIALILGILAIMAIRAPHGRKGAKIKIIKTCRTPLDVGLLMLMWLGSVILPVLWVATPIFSFADYHLHLFPFAIGALVFSAGLWLFRRSHTDLSTNWAVSLDIRENHALISSGVYRRIRHPMYAAIFLQAIGQMLLVPNWIVGPFNLGAFLLMFCCRIGPEERLMLDHFGDEYKSYQQCSKRLIPGVW
jgi:protein-S-isoprenylcysteine O-methyltransferase Ste14